MRKSLIAIAAVLLGAGFTAQANAQEDWWFDIEVILFERNTALTELQESFEFADNLAPVQADWDLIRAYLQPDISWVKQGLATCDEDSSPLWVPTPSLEQILEEHQRWQAQQLTPLSEPGDQTPEPALTTHTVQPDAGLAISPPQSEYVQPVEMVLDSDIAGYWLDYFGPQAVADIEIPAFSYCEPRQAWLQWDENGWQRNQADNRLPYPDSIPIVLDGREQEEIVSPHILPAELQELDKLSQQIRWAKGLTRMLHVAWRQPVVFGQNNAKSVRLFAGSDYASQFNFDGTAISGQSDPTIMSTDQDELTASLDQISFFQRLEQKLDRNKPVPYARMMESVQDPEQFDQPQPIQTVDTTGTPIWQLDGNVKVYLRRINQVPYLHIDSELFYRQPIPLKEQDPQALTPEYQLVSVPFRQVRRVISQQLHYFDHPLFGMVVVIRRFKNPAAFD